MQGVVHSAPQADFFALHLGKYNFPQGFQVFRIPDQGNIFCPQGLTKTLLKGNFNVIIPSIILSGNLFKPQPRLERFPLAGIFGFAKEFRPSIKVSQLTYFVSYVFQIFTSLLSSPVCWPLHPRVHSNHHRIVKLPKEKRLPLPQSNYKLL